MRSSIVVIDTGYLVELFKVPGVWDASTEVGVRARFTHAVERGWRLFVPIPVVFELANRTSQVEDGSSRRMIAGLLRDSVRKSVADGSPWILCPASDVAGVEALVMDWAEHHAHLGLAITDASVLTESARLKAEQDPSLGRVVHIWTLDRKLKAREPDAEPDAFVGV